MDFKRLLAVSILIVLPAIADSTPASATDLLVIQGDGGPQGLAFGDHGWTTFTGIVNAAAGSVATAAGAEDLSFMLQHDALWLDQGGPFAPLTANELANLAAFIATGRRVVLIGENNTWADWNDQILGLVGSSYSNSQVDDEVGSVGSNPLVAGVNLITTYTDGIDAGGGTPLFAVNVASLWGDNVVTILSANIMDDDGMVTTDNATFMNNVVNWLVEGGIGGSLSGQTGQGVLCQNFTEKGPVVGKLLEGDSSWSCTDRGLVAAPGDIIVQLALGDATGSVGGSITGLTGLGVLCKNITAQGPIVGKLMEPGETEWSCSDLGMESSPGDMIVHAVAGNAE